MVNILYNIIVSEFSTFFYVMYDYVNVTCDITLTPNSKFKIKKINRNKMRNKMEINKV